MHIACYCNRCSVILLFWLDINWILFNEVLFVFEIFNLLVSFNALILRLFAVLTEGNILVLLVGSTLVFLVSTDCSNLTQVTWYYMLTAMLPT